MAELKGTFYGVSVGPGDPELLTLQAVRLIRQCPVLAAPQTASGQMLALDIARRALGDALDGKTIVPLHFAMSRDPAVLAASHRQAARAVRPFLDAGQDVAMLNIGDVSIYATFGYLQEILQAEGYATAMAAGVPSFCAAAARLNVPLTGGMDTPLTIAPGGWADRVLETPGTKVLMKTGRQLPARPRHTPPGMGWSGRFWTHRRACWPRRWKRARPARSAAAPTTRPKPCSPARPPHRRR